LTVGILGDRALPVVEIRTKRPFFDYKAKYARGGAEEIVPAPQDTATTEQVQEWACRAHRALGCRDYSRVDFILAGDGRLVVLEANTLPGMTTNSLLPKAARAAGLSMAELCGLMVRLAWARCGVAAEVR
jgi:D-alanine-D-alanine ligase